MKATRILLGLAVFAVFAFAISSSVSAQVYYQYGPIRPNIAVEVGGFGFYGNSIPYGRKSYVFVNPIPMRRAYGGWYSRPLPPRPLPPHVRPGHYHVRPGHYHVRPPHMHYGPYRSFRR